jgi:UDP-glucose 4-epimerase
MVIRTVLITGGLGCLGGTLAKYLMSTGYEVIIGSSRKNAKLPNELKNCSLAYIDYDDVKSISKACYEVDSVIHLATTNAKKSQDNPQLAIKVNGIGSCNLIQSCVNSGVRYFLYFSTAHVYGSPLVGRINESNNPKPMHPYAITHRLAEDILLESIDKGKIKGSIFRLSNSVGLPLITDADCWMLFVNDACNQAVVDQRITIHSNPNIERDFIPLDSVCKATEFFLSSNTNSEYPVFNVGSGISYTLLQIAEMIADRCEKIFGFYPKIRFNDDTFLQNTKLEYKVDKLNSVMGHEMNHNLEHSIDEVLRFCADK